MNMRGELLQTNLPGMQPSCSPFAGRLENPNGMRDRYFLVSLASRDVTHTIKRTDRGVFFVGHFKSCILYK